MIIVKIMINVNILCTVNLRAENLVVNEVMSNPLGSETGVGSPGDRNEFVEIYNNSSNTIDLSNFLLSDGDSEDQIITWDDVNLIATNVIYGTTLLKPYSYAVILDPEYVDTGDGMYYQPYYFGDSSLILTVGNTTIGNGLTTNDPIILIFNSTDTISTYGSPDDTTDCIPFNPGDGFSVERVSPNMDDIESNWQASSDSSTPGYQNSCYISGLFIPPERISFTEDVLPGGTCIITAVLINMTSGAFQNLHVGLNYTEFLTSYDSLIFVSEEILYGPVLPYGGEDSVTFTWSDVPEGLHQIVIQCNSLYSSRLIRFGDKPGQIVLSEIMFAPTLSGEWIEIYNRSVKPCSIRLLMISGDDSSSFNLNLEGKTYFILLEDSVNFFSVYSGINCPVFQPDNWTTLSNNTDSLSIEDNYSITVDKLYYNVNLWDRGISYERVNNYIRTNDKGNWGVCVDQRGATPGEKNSISILADINTGEISVSPNPFSPNGDGIDERCIISLSLPFYPDDLGIYIYDVTGYRVRTLHSGPCSNEESFIWDGCNDGGSILPPGIYIIYINAKSADGQNYTTKKTVVLAEKL